MGQPDNNGKTRMSIIDKIGSSSPITVAEFRIVVVTISLLASSLLGILSWIGSHAVSDLVEARREIAARVVQLTYDDARLAKMEITLQGIDERLSRLEGQQSSPTSREYRP